MQGSVLGYDGVMGRAIDAELTAPCLWLKGWKAYFSWRLEKKYLNSQGIEKQKQNSFVSTCDVYHVKSWALG